MTCDDARRSIDELADGELAPGREAEVRAHVAGCDACAAELRGIQSLGSLLKRAAGSVAAPAGLAERSLRPPARRVRRSFALIPLTAAAGILVVMVGMQLFRGPYTIESALADIRSSDPALRDRAIAWADRDVCRSAEVTEDLLEVLTDSRSPERQQAVAMLIASMTNEESRRRFLANQVAPDAPWQLSSIGNDVSDVELVANAVGLVQSEKTAPDGLRVLALLDQGGLNRTAHRAIISQAHELIATGQEQNFRVAFRILDRLNILQVDLVEFIDLPDLGPKALDFLKRRSGKDFGTDKAAWRAWFESRRG